MNPIITILAIALIATIFVITKLVNQRNTTTVYNKYEIQNNVIVPVSTDIPRTDTTTPTNMLTGLPKGVAIDAKGMPYKTDRKYLEGWGKQFNAFITPQGKYYHKSKCRYCKGHQYSCIHVYDAIERGYLPCPYCKPKDKVDDWYTASTT